MILPFTESSSPSLLFWLFAPTTMNIGPLIAGDIGIPMEVMNTAISLSALFSGMFIIMFGGLDDKLGLLKIATLGNLFKIVGSLLIAFAISEAASTMVLCGRVLQGLAAGAIMPITMALLKVYWEGPARQRAVSMWPMGSWGGSSLTALFGGFMASAVLGWRSIFLICVLVSVASILLMRQKSQRPLQLRAKQAKLTGPVSSHWPSHWPHCSSWLLKAQPSAGPT